jgi:hypothetical protein
MEKKNDALLRRKIRQTEEKIDKTITDIQKKSEKISVRIADVFVKRLSDGGDIV